MTELSIKNEELKIAAALLKCGVPFNSFYNQGHFTLSDLMELEIPYTALDHNAIQEALKDMGFRITKDNRKFFYNDNKNVSFIENVLSYFGYSFRRKEPVSDFNIITLKLSDEEKKSYKQLIERIKVWGKHLKIISKNDRLIPKSRITDFISKQDLDFYNEKKLLKLHFVNGVPYYNFSQIMAIHKFK